MHVSIAAEKLFSIFGIDVTNTILTAVIVIVLLIIASFIINSKLSYSKPSSIQLFLEMVVGFLSDMVYDLMGQRRGNKLIGFLFTFFFLILFSSWFGLLPFVPTLVVKNTEPTSATTVTTNTENGTPTEVYTVTENETPTIGSCLQNRNCYITLHGIEVLTDVKHILRAPTTDLSLTVALALLAVLATNFSGFKVLKLGYLGKFFNFKNPMDGIVGLLELLSEFIKIISFSFRLFGNIFAGELLLTIMTSLTYGIGTLPFLFLEVFVGLIQAFVFFILVAIFISLAIQDNHEH